MPECQKNTYRARARAARAETPIRGPALLVSKSETHFGLQNWSHAYVSYMYETNFLRNLRCAKYAPAPQNPKRMYNVQ